MTEHELLNFAKDNGMIDLPNIQAKYAMSKYLDKHHYKIWQGKNRRWFTYLPDDKSGRKLISKSTKDDLHDTIIKYYRSVDENPKVKEIFYEWVDKKLRQNDICESTYSRYHDDFKRYFEKFGERKIRNVTEMDIEDFVKDTVSDYQLKIKAFSGLRTIMYGIFKTAKKKRYIDYNIKEVFEEIEFSRNSFRKDKKVDADQVFLEFEECRIIRYLMGDRDIVNLGLILMFKTGLRVGELCVLTKEDIFGNKIRVSKTETRFKKDGVYHIEVKDHPKTDAGNRYVILKDKYLWILDEILSKNPNGEYLFEIDKKRCTAQLMRRRLYAVCKKNGIKPKSPHKARKTYGTKLYDSGIEKSLICNQMGHTDISCLEKHYYYARMDEEYNVKQINDVESL